MKKSMLMVRKAIADQFFLWFTITLFFPVFYYVIQMLSLIIRFQNIPNYYRIYDWFDTVVLVFQSTPSFRDSLLIIREEWWLEFGYMNYDFGLGLSEWSLVIIPSKLLLTYFWGVLLATFLILKKYQKEYLCQLKLSRPIMPEKSTGEKSNQTGKSSEPNSHRGIYFASFASMLLAFSSVTMSWVVCCATPTWVIGLSMLGLGVSASLWIEPLGIWMQSIGFLALVAIIISQLRTMRSRDQEKNFSHKHHENSNP